MSRTHAAKRRKRGRSLDRRRELRVYRARLRDRHPADPYYVLRRSWPRLIRAASGLREAMALLSYSADCAATRIRKLSAVLQTQSGKS